MKRHVFLFLVLGWILLASPAWPQTQNPPAKTPPKAGATLTPAQQQKLDRAEQWVNHAGTLYRQNKFQEALQAMDQAAALRREVLGPRHPLVSDTYSGIAWVLQGAGQPAKALEFMGEALKIRREAFGEKHDRTADALQSYGTLVMQQGNYAQSAPFFQQAYAIRLEVLGDKDPSTADSAASAGRALQELGNYREAYVLIERAAQMVRAIYGPTDIRTAYYVDNLGGIHQSLGNLDAAKACHQEALNLSRKAYGENHQDVAKGYNNLAGVIKAQGDFVAARAYYEKALAICIATMGEEHLFTNHTLTNLGNTLASQGDYAAARPYLVRALEIKRRTLGPKHPAVLPTLHSLGGLCYSMRDDQAARKYYEETRDITREILGEKHPRMAGVLNDLGLTLQRLKEKPAARAALEQALAIRREVLGEEHADTAQGYHNLGWFLLEAEGDATNALPYLERGLAIRQKALAPNHPDTITSLNLLGSLHMREKNFPQAALYVGQMRRACRMHVDRVLSALSEPEQQLYLSEVERSNSQIALTFAWLTRDMPEHAATTAEWVINMKGLGQEVLTERTRLARDAQTPEGVQALAQLQAVRRQLATLTLRGPGSDRKKFDAAREELEASEQDLSRKLGELAGRAVRLDPWIKLDEVKKGMPRDAVLIEIVRIHTINLQPAEGEPQWPKPRYLAWVVPAEGAARVVDLGEVETVNALVEVVRKQLAGATKQIVELGPEDAEKELAPKLEALATQVLRPLERAAGPQTRWLISPDANLWLLPWAVLPAQDGKYLIESRSLEHVISGRSLVDAGYSSKPGLGLVVADPDFSAEMSAANAGGSGTRSGSRRSRDGAGADWARLPGTLREAQAAMPKLKTILGAAPQLYTGAQATERAVQSVQRPRMAVLSTHGYFLPDQKAAALEDPTSPELRPRKVDPGLENPLLRCGLILAGANRPRTTATAGDDGVLTGLEIVDLDLRGTELVVLSACETGLGDARNGEGVAGLRQAFQLAGARSVLASLWKVPDAETADLMSRFWEGVADGQAPADALYKAQRKMIESLRAKDQSAHPYFWGAFTVTGQPAR